MLGSLVVLAWVMAIGTVVGLPLAIVTPLPPTFDPFVFVLLLVAGLCYCLGLMLAYMALTIGKVSIVAPIVATEGAVAAVIAIALGDTVGLAAGVALAVDRHGRRDVVGGALDDRRPGRRHRARGRCASPRRSPSRPRRPAR